MVAALGLNYFACFGMLVALLNTFAAGTLFRRSRLSVDRASLRIENRNNVSQRHAVLAKQSPQLFFEIDFFLKLVVIFERLEARLVFCDLCFQLAKLCNTRHV
ncbi:hypothetical protein SB5_02145 [Pseudomonas oryzihabitans]|nr:hypothetical protein SB5_02145 [Pseudomonas psychrotolerans]